MIRKTVTRSRLLIVLSCILLLAASGCYKDNKEDMYPGGVCDTASITYVKDIQALVNGSCAIAGCHDAAGAGGYSLNTFTGVKAIADNGRFLSVIVSGSMPKNAAKLDDCSISKVRRWINLGTPEN